MSFKLIRFILKLMIFPFGMTFFAILYFGNCIYSGIYNICKIVLYLIMSKFGPYETVILLTRNDNKIIKLAKIKNNDELYFNMYIITKIDLFINKRTLKVINLLSDGSISEHIEEITILDHINNLINPGKSEYAYHWLPFMNKEKRLWMILSGARPFDYTIHDLFGIGDKNV